MSLWNDVANADTQGRGRKITEPELDQSLDYSAKVKTISTKQSNRSNETLFIVEFEITRGTPGVTEGQTYSWVQKPGRKADPGAIRKFIGACKGDGSDEPDTTEADFERAFEGAFEGVELDLVVEHIKTNAGYDFYIHTWSPPSASVTGAKAAPPTVPAPPVPEVETWTTHPDNPAYEWCKATNEIRPKA